MRQTGFAQFRGTLRGGVLSRGVRGAAQPRIAVFFYAAWEIN
jgi:hypothetical protein